MKVTGFSTENTEFHDVCSFFVEFYDFCYSATKTSDSFDVSRKSSEILRRASKIQVFEFPK